MDCAFHPGTETLLRCSKCEKPICIKCNVQTPVGARCPECANVRNVPTYNLPKVQLIQGIVVAIVVALALGVFFGLFQHLVPFRIVWFFGPAVFVGSGYAMGEAISRVTNRKRAPALQWLSIGGYVLSFIVYIMVAPESPFIGFYSLVGLAVGGALALNPFK